MSKNRRSYIPYWRKGDNSAKSSDNKIGDIGGRTRRIPQGRTLTTQDNYLGANKTESKKERPIVAIEVNARNELAVVPLSTREGKNRTQLKKYQQGQSYYKHYVEIEDDEGQPIKVNNKFRENHKNQDISALDVSRIIDKVLGHSKPARENRNKMDKFRGNKKSPRD